MVHGGWTHRSGCGIVVTPMNEPVIVRADDAAIIGYDGNLLLGAWWHAATLDHVEALREATARCLEGAQGFCTAVVALDASGVFSFADDVRKALVELVSETEETGKGTAFIVMRRGFMGAAMRAFMTGVFLVSRTKEPSRAFALPGPGAAWLAERFRQFDPGTTHTTEAIETVLTRLCARAEEQRRT